MNYFCKLCLVLFMYDFILSNSHNYYCIESADCYPVWVIANLLFLSHSRGCDKTRYYVDNGVGT